MNVGFPRIASIQHTPGLMHQFLGYELVLSVGDNLWARLIMVNLRPGWFCNDLDDSAFGSGLVSAFTAYSVPF